LKHIIKYVLRKLGYEILPLNINGAPDSLIYNSQHHTDLFYSNANLVKNYIQNNVPIHIKNLFVLLKSKKINLQDKRVVDVGCGTGHCLNELKNSFTGIQLTGIEHSEAAKKIAEATANDIPIINLDISVQPLQETFDVVLCQQVLEHIPDAEMALKHLWQMTAPKGRMLLTVPDGRLDDFAGHIHFWSKESLFLLLNKVLATEAIEIGHLQDNISLYALIKKD
jgi:2-polyprenyl-3-methyl-5-hydroxy-6-metoxy-1,4-benzoquinol methylase